jgi:hypothetical protein
VSFSAPFAHQHALLKERLHQLLHEELVSLGLAMIAV